jgi:iron complex transport system ATP-binding protein
VAAVNAAVTPRLETCALNVCAGARELVRDLAIAVHPGEFLAVLGRNGSGKTLTLLTLAGLRDATQGSVAIDGAAIGGLRRIEIAVRLGLLPQDPEPGQSMTALEYVLVGRHPHLPLWRWLGPEDRELAFEALGHVGLRELALRPLRSLSGGEQRRVAVAALLAQDPAIALLDEPTNHLDPGQAIDVLEVFRERCRRGSTVIATLHDPTVAARYADQVLLLYGDGRWRSGPASELLTSATLAELYGAPMAEAHSNGRRVFFAA